MQMLQAQVVLVVLCLLFANCCLANVKVFVVQDQICHFYVGAASGASSPSGERIESIAGVLVLPLQKFEML